MERGTCKECRFWDNKAHECHKNPPRLHWDDGDPEGEWPPAGSDGWCGEFQPREEVRQDSKDWISIKDRLPSEIELVLIWDQDHGITCCMYECGEWLGDEYHFEKVTHWMPLPEPPKEP